MNTEYFFNPAKIYLSAALYITLILFVAGIAVCGKSRPLACRRMD